MWVKPAQVWASLLWPGAKVPISGARRRGCPSHLPPDPIPPGHRSAPAPAPCLMHRNLVPMTVTPETSSQPNVPLSLIQTAPGAISPVVQWIRICLETQEMPV